MRIPTIKGSRSTIIALLVLGLWGATARAADSEEPKQAGTEKSDSKRPKGKLPARPKGLKLGQEVELKRCERNPGDCMCPHNTKGVRYISSGHVASYVCVNINCPPGKALHIVTNVAGSREGVCQ